MLAEFSNTLVQYMQNSEFSLLFLVISFLGGVLASISPCSIGMLPLIVGYVGGFGDNDKKKLTIQLVSFVFGLSVVLSIIGVICALTGNVLSAVGGSYFVLFLASLIFVMGLNLLGLVELNLSPVVKKIPKGNGTSLFIYPFLIGLLFAFAASPCSTPILASIMGFATLTKKLALSGLMLFFFALGQGVVVVLAGIFASFLKGVKKFSSVSDILLKASGVLLILAAILIYVRIFGRFF